MKHMIYFASMFLFSATVLAESSLLEAAGKQVVKDAATTAAPDAVKTLEQAEALKQRAETLPAAETSQAKDALKEAAKRKLEQATPEEVAKGKALLEKGKTEAGKIKGQVDVAPKSVDEAKKAVKHKTKKKALEKATELLQ